MNAWKIVCATLVIFLAGIITGATLVRVAQGRPGARWMQRPGGDNRSQPGPRSPASPLNPNPDNPNPSGQPPASQPPPPTFLSREFIQVLERRLQLNPEQREQMGKIMAEGQERVRELRSRIDPEMRRELQRTREQIRAVLTAEQNEQFEQMMKRPSRRGERGDQPGQPDRPERRYREPPNPPPPTTQDQ